jgi:energy-coupling factor transporter ATP-binding protein EcfA2
MLSELNIKNFQSHADSTIWISPNVTAIVGLNNHGKSAIFRALYKILRNEPDGTSFIRDGQDTCTIMLRTELGIVERTVKNNGASDANKYEVNGQEFVKFGHTGIPEEALDVFDVSPVQDFGGVEIDLNFQNQLDPLLLIQGDGLPSLRGKVLGKITGVDTVQRAIQLGAAEEKSTQQSLKKTVEEIALQTSNLEKFANVDALMEQIRVLLTEEVQIASDQKDLDRLVLTQEGIRRCVSDAKAKKKSLQSLQGDFTGALEDISGQIRIQSALDIVYVLQRDVQALEGQLEFELPVVPSEELLIDIERLEKLQDVDAALQGFSQSCAFKEGQLKQLVLDEAKAEKALQDYKNELGVCPVCEKPF